MVVDISEEQLAMESADLLNVLLKDRTTKKNIVWATRSYELLGEGFGPSDCITSSRITGNYAHLIQPRSEKSKYEQKNRTKIRAEVFTPTWLVEKQNGQVEAELEDLALKDYIQLRWLEITCGEAPYMVTRYDTVTGKEIPLSNRIGFVDKKLQRICHETSDETIFYKLVKEAYRSSYGYEYQGDSLLLARENLLATFEDYYLAKTGNQPTLEQKKEIATIISYNVFQMDGLTKTSPYSAKQSRFQQLSLFAEEVAIQEIEESKTQIKDWKKNKMIGFEKLSSEESEMKFDVVIGNPPYQIDSGTSARDDAIYNLFYDSAEKISKKYLLITPARFLFNAGSTPKKWNKKMLEDEKLKVVFYEQDSSKVFPGVGISGGVVMLYRNEDEISGPIGSFTSHQELNSISRKVESNTLSSLNNIISGRGIYRLTEKVHLDFPQIESMQSKGHKNDIGTGAFDKFTGIVFFDSINKKKVNFTKVYGRYQNKRVYKYIKSDYINKPLGHATWRVILPKAYGTGIANNNTSVILIGEPFVIEPFSAFTETYISIGHFSSQGEALNCLKYIKSKFARVLLAVLKVTQDNTREKWAKVPLQDFTGNSDIDWTKSVAEIDHQLYKKYDLSPEEIAFIETHVREMD